MDLFLLKVSFGLLVFLSVSPIYVWCKCLRYRCLCAWFLDKVSIIRQKNAYSFDQEVNSIKDKLFIFIPKRVFFNAMGLNIVSSNQLSVDDQPILITEVPIPLINAFL